MLGKLLIFNLISFNTVCNTNTNTNANEIKALTRIESEKKWLRTLMGKSKKDFKDIL